MEYSPECAIPYLSRVDAGTAEAVRRRGVEILSSGDLVQRFEAAWTPAQLETHRSASEALYRVKDRAFAAAAEAVRDGRVADRVRVAAADGGLVRGRRARQRFGAGRRGRRQCRQPALPAHGRAFPSDNSGRGACCSICGGSTHRRARCLLTSRGSASPGPRVPDEVTRAFRAAAACARRGGHARAGCGARRRASCAAGKWIAPRARCSSRRATGTRILHRTGHSLGESVHGNGVHLDDYETHDDRRVLPGTGFTIEPGLYFDTFGVRTEINMYRGEREALVTGPRQTDVVTLT